MAGFDVTARFQLIDAFSAQAAKVSASAEAVRANMAGLSAGVDQAGKSMGAASGSMAPMIGNLQVLAGAALAGGLYKLVSAATEFESKMADIYKVAPGIQLTVEQMNRLKDTVLDLAATIPVATSEIQEIVATGFQLGVGEDEIKEFTKITSQMKVAFGMTAEDVGDKMGKIRNQYQLTMETMREFGNVTNALGNAMPVHEKNIIDFMSRASGVTAMIKMSIPDLQAMGAAMVSVGTPAEVAARAMNNFAISMSTIESTAAKSKDMAQALEILGLSAQKIAQGMQVDGAKTIQTILERLKAIPDAQRGFVAKQIFGMNFSDDFMKLAKVPKILDDAFKLVRDKEQVTGSLQREFERRSQTTLSQWQLFKNSLTELGQEFGTTLLPVLNSVLVIVTAITSAITSAMSGIREGIDFVRSPIAAAADWVTGTQVKEGSQDKRPGELKAEDFESSGGGLPSLLSDIGDFLKFKDFPGQAEGKVDVNVKVTAAPGVGATTSVTSTGKGLNVGSTSAGKFNANAVGQNYGY